MADGGALIFPVSVDVHYMLSCEVIAHNHPFYACCLNWEPEGF